jgi:hypothetical protein
MASATFGKKSITTVIFSQPLTHSQMPMATARPPPKNPPPAPIPPVPPHPPATYAQSFPSSPPFISPAQLLTTRPFSSHPTLSTHWTTLPWKQYILQAFADLTTGSWLAVGIPQIGRGQTTTQNVPVIEPGSTAPPRRFLRVAVADLDRDSDTLMYAEKA